MKWMVKFSMELPSPHLTIRRKRGLTPIFGRILTAIHLPTLFSFSIKEVELRISKVC